MFADWVNISLFTGSGPQRAAGFKLRVSLMSSAVMLSMWTWCSFLKQSESSDWNLSSSDTNSSAVNDSKHKRCWCLTRCVSDFPQVNITSGNVTFCFNGFFNPETGGDCVVERSRGAESFYFETYSYPYYYGYDYCYFYIHFNNVSVFLYHTVKSD